MNDAGVNKAAILLLTLGSDEAAEVMKFLEPREIQKITSQMVTLRNLTREEIADVFEEFYGEASKKTTFGLDSDEYIRSMLQKALGADRAAGLIDRVLHNSDTSGIEGLKWMDANSIADLLSNEHPQIIATIMVHLEPDLAASVLALLTERTRNDVMMRIATLDSVQPIALHELNEVLTALLTGNSLSKKSIKGGVRTAAEILNLIGSTQESVLDSVRDHDEDLAQKIMDEMFIFEDILEIEDRSIQLILREVQSESLIVALKGASEELRDKILKNMSQRAAEMLREDLESKGPVKLSEVEAEQKEILKIVRRLVEEGQVTLGGKGEEAYV
jgi:flagellar motor switch protein FliG